LIRFFRLPPIKDPSEDYELSEDDWSEPEESLPELLDLPSSEEESSCVVVSSFLLADMVVLLLVLPPEPKSP